MTDASCQTLVETGQPGGRVKPTADEHRIPWYTKKNEYSKGKEEEGHQRV